MANSYGGPGGYDPTKMMMGGYDPWTALLPNPSTSAYLRKYQAPSGQYPSWVGMGTASPALPGANNTSNQVGYASKPYYGPTNNGGNNAMPMGYPYGPNDPDNPYNPYSFVPPATNAAAPSWQSGSPQAAGTPTTMPGNPAAGAPAAPAGAGQMPVSADPWGQLSRVLPDNFQNNYRYILQNAGMGALAGTPAASLANHMMGRALGQYIANSVLGNVNPQDTTGFIQSAMSNPASLLGSMGNAGGANSQLGGLLQQFGHGDFSGATSRPGQVLMDLMQDPTHLQDYILGQTGYGFGSTALAQMLPTILSQMQVGGANGPLGSLQAAFKLLGTPGY